nr:DUF4181 domain-containing protein [Sporosarcina sp. BI001-red]
MLNSLLRRYFKLDKLSFFKSNYVNDKHRKIEWILRFILIFGYLVMAIIMSSGEKTTTTFFFVTQFNRPGISESVFAEKYAENKNEYIPTLIQLGLLIIVVPTIFYTKIFGWFA